MRLFGQLVAGQKPANRSEQANIFKLHNEQHTFWYRSLYVETSEHRQRLLVIVTHEHTQDNDRAYCAASAVSFRMTRLPSVQLYRIKPFTVQQGHTTRRKTHVGLRLASEAGLNWTNAAGNQSSGQS